MDPPIFLFPSLIISKDSLPQYSTHLCLSEPPQRFYLMPSAFALILLCQLIPDVTLWLFDCSIYLLR